MEAMGLSSSWTSIRTLRPNSLSLFPFLYQYSNVAYYRHHTAHLSKSLSVKVNATSGKGFGNMIDKKSKTKSKERPDVCPCGGGDMKLEYHKCCKTYHDGASIEEDATTLMKARFSAYAKGIADYIVKTTHPQNPDFQGADQLAADVRATCTRLLFTKLEILNTEHVSENEVSILFRATYLSRKGNKGDKKFLVEKSLFVQERDRWFYKEKLSHTGQMESSNTNFIQAELARKALKSSISQQNLKSRKR